MAACRSACALLGLLAILQLLPVANAGEVVSKHMILGYVERIWFDSGQISMKAKLDTGAKTSSIDARNIEYFQRKGRKWVRFDMVTRDPEQPMIRMEQPVKRHVQIKRHLKENQRRAVVMLEFCIGGKPMRGEFNLINRERFIYPVLLGRQVLKKVALIDSDASFLGGRECAPESAS